MKYFLFALILFCLPHLNWLPLQFEISPEQIPLGAANLIFMIAFMLFVSCPSSYKSRINSIFMYKYYLILVCSSMLFALINSFEIISVTFTLFKQQILLLLLFYLPLSSIDDESEFRKIFYILLLIHVVIGFEVMRSGVLGGSSYHDGKRGSGPFSEGLTGSDIAGSYLSQVVMFLLAIVFSSGFKFYQRASVTICSVVIIFGIFATYARGALVACVVGLIAMFPFFGFKAKYIIIAASIAFAGIMLAPDSISTRFDYTKTDSGEYDESTQGRFYYWNAAFQIIKENPLGVGVGQVRGAMQSKIGKHVDPHNGFLYTACEYGIIGLTLFIMMLVQMYKYSFKIWKNDSLPNVYRTYALGMAGFLGSFVTCNMFYANFYKDLVMGTVVIHFGMLAYILSDINQKKEANTL
jgi:O-antigen ligase